MSMEFPLALGSVLGAKNEDLPFKVGTGGGGRILNLSVLLVQFLLITVPNLKNQVK